MSPLERGVHSLNCETLSKDGRGNKGGLNACSRSWHFAPPNDLICGHKKKVAITVSEETSLTIKVVLVFTSCLFNNIYTTIQY